MTLNYKILGQLYYGPDFEYIPGNGGYGYYGGNIGGQGEDGSYVEVIEPQVLYTVPENAQTTVTSLFITNHDLVERTYDLAVVPSGQELSLKHYIRWDMPVESNNIDLIDAKITMSAGDKIYVFPSTINKVGFTAFGVEKV
jgi:hypothetical protein